MRIAIQSAIEEIKTTATPEGWNDWLFSLQNHLIRTGYFEASTESHCIDHVERIESLRNLFKAL